jgi:AcrR family transcriptional regulator
MVRPIKRKQIPHLQEAIKETAWKQIAEVGAPALSLRAIARELKITAPAIYNYFPDRDELVTQLIIDAFNSFGDSQFQARDSVSSENHRQQMRVIGIAYRAWAHQHPQRYQLIFGTQIPNYKYPHEKIFPASSRSIVPLFSVVENARTAGKLNATAYQSVTSGYEAHIEMWKMQKEELHGQVHPLTHFVSMIIWSRVHGIVSLELQGNLPLFGDDGNALFEYEMDLINASFLR